MNRISRRGALAGAGAGILLVKPGTALGSQANSAVSLGVIGTGGRGRYVGTIFVKDPRTRLAAICDLYPDRIDLAKTQLPGADKVPVYKRHEELLATAGIDAVLIATPVYLHPEHFEHAINARKHIYCEKPAGADVAGIKRLMRAAERADKSKHIQFGFQQRYSPEYLAAEKIITSRQLGSLSMMRSHWLVGGSGSKPRVQYPPEVEKLRMWYPWKATSGDFIVEQDCHGVDVLNWFAKSRPLSAIGGGGRKVRTYGDNLDHVNVTYAYPNGLNGFLHGCQLARNYSVVNEQFFGTQGFIETARQYYEWRRGQNDVVRVQSKREITIDAVEYFLKAILDGKPENNSVDAAESTLTSVLGRMAVETRREITWDEMMRSA
jgi:predicted dehydrogenase